MTANDSTDVPRRSVHHASDFEIPGGRVEPLEELVPAPGMMGHTPKVLTPRGAHVLFARKAFGHLDTTQAEMANKSLSFTDGVPAPLDGSPENREHELFPQPVSDRRMDRGCCGGNAYGETELISRRSAVD